MSQFLDSFESACDVIETLQNAGHQAVFAGGCVRDILLGVEPKDIDIATSATPDQVEALFPKTVAVGKSFGVIRVLYDGEEFEVATFRTDSKSGDGRRPDSVSFSSMEEDAKRRDLTINALFLDPIAEKFFDFVGGQDDIKARRIRFVGNPEERIEEDKLRMLRVVRFACRGGWHIEPKTHQAVLRNAEKISVVSRERIADELTKILTHKFAWQGFRALLEHNLWEHTVPAVADLVSCTQEPKWHPEGDVFRHTELMLKFAGEKLVGNPVLAWGIVLHDIAKPHTWAKDANGRITAHGHAEKGAEVARDILNNLRFDGDTVNSVCNLVAQHMKFWTCKEMKGSTRMKLIADKDFDNMLELHRCDALASNGDLSLHEYLIQVRQSTPVSQIHPEKLVDGNDLISLGMKPGKVFKTILQTIADEQREGRISTRESALELAKKLVAESNSQA